MYSVSSSLVALVFVSQVADGVGAVFNVFALTVLPAIYFLGCATYVRLVHGAETGWTTSGLATAPPLLAQ